MKQIILFTICVFGSCLIYALPVTSGLLAYYDFNTGIQDVSGANRATTVNQAITSAGAGFGGSTGLVLDGVDDYVRVDGLPFNTTASASNTVSFWMKWSGYNKSQGDMPVGFSDFDLWIQANHFGFNSNQGDITGINNADTTLANTWFYVTAVFTNSAPSPSTHRLYINGVQQTTSQLQGSTPVNWSMVNYMYMGTYVYGNYYFKGALDEVAVYNRGLTSVEVSQLYNSYICPVPEPHCLLLVMLSIIALGYVRKIRG